MLTESLTIQIRPMQLDDLDQVVAIDQMSFSLPWPINAFRHELLENDRTLLWVAETRTSQGQNIVIGAIVVWLIIDEAHIATIAVHPHYRSHRVGSRLLIAALKESMRWGCRSATLEVRASNIVAQQFYSRFHFEVVGRRVRYYLDNNEDALIMTVQNLDLEYDNWIRGYTVP